MANVNITKKPKDKVSRLGSPYISSGHTLTADWTVPSVMTSGKNNARSTNLVIDWTLGMEASPNKLSKVVSTSTNSADINLDRIVFSNGTERNRSYFYPVNPNNKLTSVTISVKGKNTYKPKKKKTSKTGYGEAVTATRQFELPESPTIDEITLNPQNGVVSTTIRTSETVDYKERYDTVYKGTVYRSSTNTTTEIASASGTSTSTEISVSYDVNDYKSMSAEGYIKVTWTAYARGYAGNSNDNGNPLASRSIILAYPAKAVIEKPIVPEGVSGAGDGYVTVPVDTKHTEKHPVVGVKLEYAKNTTYENASDVPDSAFAESGIEDNGDCTALTMPVSLFEQERGKHSWVRVKSYGEDESVLYRYSNYEEVKALYLEPPSSSPSDTAVDVLSVASGEDGESAVVTLGWNKSGTDEYTGTELSWSDDKKAWKSTKDPDHYEFTWSDGQKTVDSVTYHDSAEITIMGLNRDTMYYVKARRYLEGDTTTYGAYSPQEGQVIPTSKPTIVVPRCAPSIAVGKPLGVYWSFGGGGLQTRWRITNNSDGVNLADGSGSIGFAQIDANTVSNKAVNGKLEFKVWVTTGGGEKDSDLVSVNVVPQPTLSIGFTGAAMSNGILTANALRVTATTPRPCNLAVTITAQGNSGDTPMGYDAQLDGDVVYSEEIASNELTWSNGTATVSLPTDCDFRDNGQYTVFITAIDPEFKLRSEEKKKSFTVKWARKAADPVATITPVNDTSGGSHIQGVRITLSPPTGSQTGDVYDIYRMDGSNPHLIGKGFPLTYDEIDEYAPIGGSVYQVSKDTEDYSTSVPSAEGWYEYDGENEVYFASTDNSVSASKTYYDVEELYYRIAFRTVDGDVAFTDIPYAFPSDIIRLDWQTGSLELPYGNSIGDSYSKAVEFRQHMDGSVDGYWNKNIERKGSYNSSIIKLIQPDDINMARALARYAGAVFVRTANGSAFVADVQVTDLSVKNKAITAIAIDATEVDITEEFMLDNPYEQGDSE
nr:hypothetical protein [Clostridia bacterium]